MNIIGVACDIEGNHASAAKAGIEAAVGIQPDRAEVAIDAAAQQDPAIGLYGQVIAIIVAAVEDNLPSPLKPVSRVPSALNRSTPKFDEP